MAHNQYFFPSEILRYLEENALKNNYSVDFDHIKLEAPDETELSREKVTSPDSFFYIDEENVADNPGGVDLPNSAKIGTGSRLRDKLNQLSEENKVPLRQVLRSLLDDLDQTEEGPSENL